MTMTMTELNRRNFLHLSVGAGTVIVLAGTMAEAGMWAEFLSWLHRKPAWSFPSLRSHVQTCILPAPVKDMVIIVSNGTDEELLVQPVSVSVKAMKSVIFYCDNFAGKWKVGRAQDAR